VVRALANQLPPGVRVSIDTQKPIVAAAALVAGATVLNDVGGLRNPEMAAVSADAWGTVVMHMRGTPQTMAAQTTYEDVVAEVRDALVKQASKARSERVWIDPGIGFAKTAAQSLALLRGTAVLAATGYPVFVGASRKSFIGRTLGLPRSADRLPGSLAANLLAWQAGATALRVHDVAETRQAVDLAVAVARAGRPA
jgi:dihydropteroate synthase